MNKLRNGKNVFEYLLVGERREEERMETSELTTHVQQSMHTAIQVSKKSTQGEPDDASRRHSSMEEGSEYSDEGPSTHNDDLEPPESSTEAEMDDRAPLFMIPLFDQTAELDEAIILETKVDGDPMPKVTWYYKGQELHDRKLYDFVYSPEGDLCLVVKRMKVEDEGEYTCVATNEYGTATSKARLTLQGVWHG